MSIGDIEGKERTGRRKGDERSYPEVEDYRVAKGRPTLLHLRLRLRSNDIYSHTIAREKTSQNDVVVAITIPPNLETKARFSRKNNPVTGHIETWIWQNERPVRCSQGYLFTKPFTLDRDPFPRSTLACGLGKSSLAWEVWPANALVDKMASSAY